MRRLARQAGLRLVKNRSRDDRLPDFGGYMLLDDCNVLVWGCMPHQYSLKLEDIGKAIETPAASHPRRAA
jgi:hypothetical protein